MTSDALSIVQCLFSDIWSLFTSWVVPGTHFTPGEWGVFALTMVLCFHFIHKLMDDGQSESDVSDSTDIAVR